MKNKTNKYNQFSFENKNLFNFMSETKKMMLKEINKIIKKNSPVQVGDDVRVLLNNSLTNLRVSEIKLCALSSGGYPCNTLSFDYYGIRLSKKGEPMKRRNPVNFSRFVFKEKSHNMPSYNRVEIIADSFYKPLT